jgi:hypothetical protein
MTVPTPQSPLRITRDLLVQLRERAVDLPLQFRGRGRRSIEQHYEDVLEHCNITILYYNILFFKRICILTECPDIRDREPTSVPRGLCLPSSPQSYRTKDTMLVFFFRTKDTMHVTPQLLVKRPRRGGPLLVACATAGSHFPLSERTLLGDVQNISISAAKLVVPTTHFPYG